MSRVSILTSHNANLFISPAAHSGGFRLVGTSLVWLALEQGCDPVAELTLGKANACPKTGPALGTLVDKVPGPVLNTQLLSDLIP